jgi:hypothetical protein
VTYGFWLQVVGAHFGQVRDGVKPIFHGTQERNPAPERRIRPASPTHGSMNFPGGHKYKSCGTHGAAAFKRMIRLPELDVEQDNGAHHDQA